MKRKMETSKKILLVSYIIAIILTLIVIVCTFGGIDCGNITTLASTAWVEISVANTFYYTMCKRINVPKVIMGIYKDLPDDLKNDVDINNLLSNLVN